MPGPPGLFEGSVRCLAFIEETEKSLSILVELKRLAGTLRRLRPKLPEATPVQYPILRVGLT